MGADAADDVAADASADVADDVSFDPTCDPTQPTRILTRPGSAVKPDPGQRSDPTRSMVNRVNGHTRPGQHNPDPVARAATCCHTRRTFWWRVRVRERVILGNFGTYRFVSKFPTMWYIDLACLKLLQI